MATYIAHGDVALSVLMTTASTLGAIFMTPLLTKLLAGTLVPVDAVVSPAHLHTHVKSWSLKPKSKESSVAARQSRWMPWRGPDHTHIMCGG